MENDRLQQVLQGKEDNYLLPFFWLHGEEQEVVEEYIEKSRGNTEVFNDCGNSDNENTRTEEERGHNGNTEVSSEYHVEEGIKACPTERHYHFAENCDNE